MAKEPREPQPDSDVPNDGQAPTVPEEEGWEKKTEQQKADETQRDERQRTGVS